MLLAVLIKAALLGKRLHVCRYVFHLCSWVAASLALYVEKALSPIALGWVEHGSAGGGDWDGHGISQNQHQSSGLSPPEANWVRLGRSNSGEAAGTKNTIYGAKIVTIFRSRKRDHN
jgi:hypothetical protein